MRGFKGRDRLAPRDRGKIIQEFIEALPRFEVVDEVAQRHARADEDRRSAQDLRVAMNRQGC